MGVIFSGIGLGLVTCVFALLNFYFDRRRALANGIVSAASGIGGIGYPYMYRTLISEYGFQGTLLIVGGILFNCCVAGAICRQPIQVVSKQSIQSYSFPKFIRKVFTFRWKLFKNKSFCLLDIAFAVSFLGFYSTLHMIPVHVVHIGFSKYDAALCMLILGITECIFRVVLGWFADLKIVSSSMIIAGSMAIGGAAVLCLALASNFTMICVCGAVIGAFPGVLFVLFPVITVEKMGLNTLPAALGLIQLSWSILFLIGQPALGEFHAISYIYAKFKSNNERFP